MTTLCATHIKHVKLPLPPGDSPIAVNKHYSFPLNCITVQIVGLKWQKSTFLNTSTIFIGNIFHLWIYNLIEYKKIVSVLHRLVCSTLCLPTDLYLQYLNIQVTEILKKYVKKKKFGKCALQIQVTNTQHIRRLMFIQLFVPVSLVQKMMTCLSHTTKTQ